MHDNPFAVVTPEELEAEQAEQLFVEMYSDYPEITRPGNTLITGARGCGKSMLIRCSMPDVLMIKSKKKFSELPYVAVNVSVRKTSLNLQELHRLDKKHVPYMINEHFLSLHVAMQAFLGLSKIEYDQNLYNEEIYREFYNKYFIRYLKVAGYKDTEKMDIDYSSPNTFFLSIYENLFFSSCEFVEYLSRLFSNPENEITYSQPLLSFTRFIVPVFTKLLELPNFPQRKPLLIFIDDADNLSTIQTEILNSWLACRTQPTISLKVSSQIGMYKTYLTSSGVLVECPHDYQEVNISFLYTTKSSSVNNDFYFKAIEIIYRRLQIYGYRIGEATNSVHEMEEYLNRYLPYYDKQEEGIKEEEKKIRQTYETMGRGYTVSDDVRRYAIPNYIRNLGGIKKARHTYRYAGLGNVIHLSSGIIRYLLDALASMYDLAYSKKKDSINQDDDKINVEEIPTEIQNVVMRQKADFYLFTEIKKANSIESINENNIEITSNPQSLTDKLANLINAMGKTFQDILFSGNADVPFSGRAERKVFSVALSSPNNVDNEIMQVFNLGVRLGFFHESYIGNKAGNGRTYLYVLNRCFAPIFTLDPTGFQGYLFVTNEDIKKAIYSGKCLKAINDENTDTDNEIYQLTLSDFWED